MGRQLDDEIQMYKFIERLKKNPVHSAIRSLLGSGKELQEDERICENLKSRY